MELSTVTSNLIEAINDFNAEEAIYWAHLLKQNQNTQIVELGEYLKLFDGFKLGNQELSLLIAELIWNLVKNEDFPVIYEKFSSQIQFGLSESCDEAVQKLCLKIIFQLGLQKDHKIDEATLKLALQPIIFTNYSVSAALIKLIADTKKIRKDLDNLISEELLNLYSSSKTDSVVQFRFFELFRTLNLEQSQHLSQTLFTELKSILLNSRSDPLLAANGLQIIQDCIERSEQFDIFCSEGIIDLMVNLVDDTNTFLSCKTLDVFAQLALSECFSFHEFVGPRGLDRKVINACEDDNKKGSAIFCLTSLATLSQNPQSLLKSLDESFLIHSSSSIQLSAIHSLAIFFSSSNQSAEVKVQFLLHLNSSFQILKLLQEHLNSTFDEQKSAAYFAIKSILSTDSCLMFILSNSTIFAMLLQRSSDDSMLGLKWKYGIMEQIYGNGSLFSCLNDSFKDQVKKYLSQGVTFIPKTVQVALNAD